MFENRIPPTSSQSDSGFLENQLEKQHRLSLRERLRHFTWAWYTLTMSTGGLALLIASQPYTFKGLKTIGLVVYIVNLILFGLVCSLMATRFILHGGFLDSLRHEREGLFFPTFWLSVATIITGLHRYFGSDARESYLIALEVLFWVYCACTLATAVIQYSFIFSAHRYGLQTMMPSWILPAFPIMLSGTIASVIGEAQPARSSIPVIMAGVTFQGLGFSISFMMYAHYIGRLMESGLPCREHRPGMFICVGPPAFTALALVGMAKGLPAEFKLINDAHALEDARILELLAITAGIFLWALSLWFFFIAVIAVLRSPPTSFHLNWWALVFPNTGFTLATITLGKALGSPGILGVGSAMSLGIVGMWLFVFVSHIRAIINQDIMYPGKDEDAAD
ncbi:tellurite-resistance/dicarboxylate transporter family protein [Aspergillus clavatus NRRL 1]|uniref:C4-dicarboxylate transporter/malic acid transport protein, putative n=1 Tax=Aspergillus clavatus (strain ATCC 1007 / CBS 513.65 / DSM 816 / NCTC 3887 / NRRL 1 / QM 1276 / 107) TaxID=344612 RepID=A1C406_ASPCL|nr:C4-dicarboxylate transporter/malic acid transport protein, putative [Aspergillus clavatus NRRL 1]EAW15146.1 C4-dicarboxylate transporter/malic acid transport protein, putative [Aspergillus clavatus NRRL 1]